MAGPFPATFCFIALPARNCQSVLLSRDGDLLGRKSCEGQRNAIALLAGTRDVVRRIGVLNGGLRLLMRSNMRSKPTVDRDRGEKS